MRIRLRFLLAWPAALTTACTTAPAPLEAYPDHFRASFDTIVFIEPDGTDCRFALSPDGPWHKDFSKLGEFTDTSKVALRVDIDAPWQCVTKTVFELQETGATVAFISEPHRLAD